MPDRERADPAKKKLREAFTDSFRFAPDELPYAAPTVKKVALPPELLESPEGKLPTAFLRTDDGLTLVHSPCGKKLPIPEGIGSYEVSQIAWAHTCGQS